MRLIIAPRTRREISADPIRLKPPPNKKPFEKQAVFLTIMPSLSMSLPMLLGFYLMSRGRQESATGFSYMTMGITTAIGSALIGALIAAANLRKRNEKMRYDERLRKRSYRSYLSYLEDTFREHVTYTENILRNEYPLFSELVCPGESELQDVICLDRKPLGKITIPIGTGEKPHILPINYDDDYRLIPDTLQNEMAELIERNSILRRVPVCVSLNEGDCISVLADKMSDLFSIFIMLVARICLYYSPDKLKVGFRLKNALYGRALDSLKFMPHLFDLSDKCDTVLIIFTDTENELAGLKTADYSSHDPIMILLGFEGGNQLLHKNGEVTYFVDEAGRRSDTTLDLISQSEFEAVLRTTCRLRDFEAETDSAGIPENVPILEMLHNCGSICDDIFKNWQADAAIYDLTIPLGIGQNHKLVFLNPHERGDGPHGLIAGMTGSGKSELLMSMILTMAVKYPPWYAAFFLIDYKGGGMAANFEKLPHVIGSISNLSGSDIGRAFLSIRSENERRERLFYENGVNNILKYQEKYRDGKCSEPLPHIFIIIDEFAQLKLEEPDFMQDMISMSRVGRSLGIHLILCTQKPSGSVDGQIISNSGFQIALKLQDPMDSKEIIRRVDAAYLNNPGRAILRCGNDERIEMFQAAYSLSPAVPPKRKIVAAADYYGRPVEPVYLDEASDSMSSLEYLMREITEAAKKSSVRLRPLWLKELPEELSIQALYEAVNETLAQESSYGGEIRHQCATPIGLWDDPVTVSQGIFWLNLNDGNLLVCGQPYSGKSVLVRTLLRSVFEQYRIIIFDWGGGVLSEYKEYFAEGNQCPIEYFTEGDEENAQAKMRELLDGNIIEQHTKGNRRTALVIDGIGSLVEQAGYGISTLIKELLRKSELLNIRMVVTAYGINAKEVNKGMQGYFRQFISLRQQDMYQYSEVLSEPHFRGRCDLCPGRGYARLEGRIVEIMIAR